mgnify:FL=1
MTKESTQPLLTIDGVQINPDELSDKGKHIVARLHQLTNDKNLLLVRLQEKDIVIKAFRNELIADYQSDNTEPEEEDLTVKSNN